MKRKSLLFLLLFALMAPWAANAQTTVTIGEGTATCNTNPIGTYYNYSIAEQLYTAEEIGTAGTISSISFYYMGIAAKDLPITVYMKHVDEENLASAGITLADADEVFSGTLPVTTTAGWVTINLATPFAYDGSSNLLIGFIKDYLYYFNGQSWQGTATTATMARYTQSDSAGPYTTSTVPGTAQANRPNIQMEIVAGSGPFCAKPTRVAVNYTGGITAEVSWNSDAASFNIDVNGTVTENVTNPYTLTGLDLATTYTVKVQAVCGGENGSSDWTSGTSFTTDMCMPEEMCNLTFVLTDSYGDSWNGNAIVLTDVQTGTVLATMANENLDGVSGSSYGPETQTVTLAVCDGRPIEFSWTAGSYVSEVSYTVTDINNEVIVEGSGEGFETFTFTPNCTPVTCARPENVVATYNGGTTAEVSWTGEAAAFNIDVNGTVTENVTSPYTLTNLDLATTYTVMVQANCGTDGLSNWTSPVSFRTDLCMPENMCAITFQFVDSYGDGWNGAAMQVYDYDTIAEELTLLGEYTIESGSSANYTLNVCDGRFLVFFWSEGNYDSECQYAVYDNLGDPIFSGSGAMDDYELFFMNCNSTCRMPRNFAASEITGHEVMLSWTELGEATSWTLAYMAETDTVVSYIEDITTNPYLFEGLIPNTKYYAMISPNCEDQYKWSETITWTTDDACPKPHITVVPTPTSAEVSWTGYADDYTFEWAQVPAAEAKDALWLQYDDDTYVGGIGNSSANTWTWGVMYPADMLEGNGLVSKVSIYETSDYNTEDITINIYSGGDDAPGELVYTETVTPEAADAFHEITLSEVVTVDPTQNLWITLTEYGTYVMPYCQNGDNANNDWVLSGSWAHIGDLASSLAGDTWMIRAYVEPAFDPDEIDWQPVADATSPVTLSPLTPETQYAVRIMALCGGEDGESKWSTVYFWTPALCTTPFDLAANDIAATSANLSWTGYQESYNLRYRQTVTVDPSTPATIILEAHDVWEDESGYQMLLDATHSLFGDVIPESGPLTAQGSCETTPADLYDAFTYTIPEDADPSCDPENFVFDGSVTIQIPAGTYDWCIVNPSSGDRIWIAGEGDIAGRYDDYVFEPGVTYHFTMQKFGSGDGAALEIIRDWGDWTTGENIPNPYAFTGLTPETHYEWQVQGVNCSEGNNTDWSEIATFTTPELTTITQTIALSAGTNWISSYVEIELTDLQTALTDVLGTSNVTITISSQTDNSTLKRGRWTGQLTSLDLTQMYTIEVPSDCEITLEGMPIDPAQLTLNISFGENWIAFPFTENMALADAFAGFATSNDAVSSQTENATYKRNKWTGTLSTLVPGQGYIYSSVTNGTQPFVYPTASKSAKGSERPATMGLQRIERTRKGATMELTLPQAKQITTLEALKAEVLSNFKKMK